MKLKKAGCSFLYFVLAVFLLFGLLNMSATVFWILIGVLIAAVIGLILFQKHLTKKREALEAEESKPVETTEDKPLVILSEAETREALGLPAEPEALPETEEQVEEEAFEAEEAEAEEEAPAEEPIREEDGNLMYTGRYQVGEDIPEGKYDFKAVRGSGYLQLLKADGNIRVAIPMGTQDRSESTAYKNAICTAGETLVLDGSLVLAVKKSQMLTID